MEIRPLRQFKSQELRSLFDQEREVWERQLYWDYGEPQRVISAMVDSGTLPGFVAIKKVIRWRIHFMSQRRAKDFLGDVSPRKGAPDES